jgi:hypothetical protein
VDGGQFSFKIWHSVCHFLKVKANFRKLWDVCQIICISLSSLLFLSEKLNNFFCPGKFSNLCFFGGKCYTILKLISQVLIICIVYYNRTIKLLKPKVKEHCKYRQVPEKLWLWLYLNENKMFCKVCMKAGKKNTMTIGCTTFKTGKCM